MTFAALPNGQAVIGGIGAGFPRAQEPAAPSLWMRGKGFHASAATRAGILPLEVFTDLQRAPGIPDVYELQLLEVGPQGGEVTFQVQTRGVPPPPVADAFSDDSVQALSAVAGSIRVSGTASGRTHHPPRPSTFSVEVDLGKLIDGERLLPGQTSEQTARRVAAAASQAGHRAEVLPLGDGHEVAVLPQGQPAQPRQRWARSSHFSS